jgi:hypothetical protein
MGVDEMRAFGEKTRVIRQPLEIVCVQNFGWPPIGVVDVPVPGVLQHDCAAHTHWCLPAALTQVPALHFCSTGSA